MARCFSPSHRRGLRGLARFLTVGAVVTAVVAGSATGVLAAPASAPTARVANAYTLAPVLLGEATADGSGAESLRFSARTVGATTWNLLDGVSVAGTRAFQALPSGRLSLAEGFEYQVAHCDDTGCTASPVQTGYVSSSLGAGERPGATRMPVTIGDRIGGQVDLGSGNLLLTPGMFTLPRRSGAALEVGLAYNSTTRRDAYFPNAVGDAASGWRLSTGADVRLRFPGDGSAVYHGPDGLTGTFVPDGSGGFVPPAGFKMTLTAVSGGGWELFDHGSGHTRHFDAGGRMTALADRNGNATTFSYDAGGGLTRIRTDVGGPGASTLTVAREGSGAGRITAISQTADGYDGTTRSVALSYDASGLLASLTDAEGRVTEFVHGTGGNLNRVTAPGGGATEFSYDELGRVQSITQPTADPAVTAVTTIKYTAERTVVTDPNGNATTYELTGDGRELVAKATDPAGHVRSATYTPFLDVASATDPAGTATFGYDPAVNGGESLTSTTSATGAGSSFAYGNTAAATRYQPTQGTDGQGNTSTYTYNGAGNRLSATDAGSAQASVTYNGDGTVATSTSPSGAVTTYTYNGVGQLTGITPPADSTLGQRSLRWDAFGRPAARTDGRGITETYTYDHLDRITQVAWSDGTPTVTYTYDARGSLDTRTDASGTTDYGHDPLGRLTSRTHTASPGADVSYAYDQAGNLTTAATAAGTTSYAYDARNLVREMTGPDGRLIGFAHDPAGRRTDTWFATNTARSSWAAHTRTTYDDAGRITRTWTARNSSDTTRVFDTGYSYAEDTDGGLCTTATTGHPDSSLRWATRNNLTGVWTNYCYDTANRLIMADPGDVGPTRYTYDANGNRIQTSYGTTVTQTQTVNAADQLTMAGYAHDAAGNTLTDSHGAYTYNGAGQLTGFTDGDDSGAYTFAGTDQTELITDGRGRTYSYGRTDATGLPLIESYTDGGATFGYLYDPTGTPLAITGANTHYLALDGLGSVVAAINHTGTQTAAYTYDPWGQATATGVNGSGIVHYQLFGYAGGVTDPDTGLVHFGQRWYDPVTGRFTQQDALETLADPRRANRYEYANSNPINYIDPTGRAASSATFCLVACISVASGSGDGYSLSIGVGVGSPEISAGIGNGGPEETGVDADYTCGFGPFGFSVNSQGEPGLSASTEEFSVIPSCSAITYFSVGF